MTTEKLLEFIQSTNEKSNVDYKKELYNLSAYKDDFVKDIMAMANSYEIGDKYIIIGVKDSPILDREIVGINGNEIRDSADYQQIIRENIEPNMVLDIEKHEVRGKTLLCLRISSTMDRPYVIKKDLNKLKKGDMWIRINSSQSKVTRTDLETMYKERVELTNIELQKLKIKRNEISKELLFISLLNENITYVYNSYYELHWLIGSHLKEKDEINDLSLNNEIRYKTHQRFLNMIDKARLKIKNFECRELPKEYLYDLLVECNYKCFSKYSVKLIELEQSYLYLKNNLKKFNFDLNHCEKEIFIDYDERLKFYDDLFLSAFKESGVIPRDTDEINKLQNELEGVDFKISQL